MPIPYWQAAERAQRALERVLVTVQCPLCDGYVSCVVNGTDVTVPACPDNCGGRRRFEMIAADALDRAAGERADYAQHLREQS